MHIVQGHGQSVRSTNLKTHKLIGSLSQQRLGHIQRQLRSHGPIASQVESIGVDVSLGPSLGVNERVPWSIPWG